jgi:hypothetical protein
MNNRYTLLAVLLMSMSAEAIELGAAAPASAAQSQAEREVIELSRKKWLWMAERNIEALDKLIDGRAIFVHMGANFSKAEELDVIRSGRIQYKQTDVQEISARMIGDTAIVMSRIQLFALVGGNEARNPFTVTETYVKQADGWRLVSLAFTRRTTPN